MKKRLISGLLSAVMATNVITMLPANAFALGSESRTYEKDGYTVTYRIGEEWDSNRSVEVTIENTGEESILNWALKYDVGGEVYNLWNSRVYDSIEEYSIIKNNGYNYEIEPGESANYGYIVRGDETVIPEDIELCSRRIDVRSGYDVDFTVADDWNTGFTASVTLTNTSAEPIEAWTLLFDGNFDIKDIWGAKLLSSEERSYETAAEQWTNPIASGSSITFGFTADKSATENANAENFALTAVIVGESSLVYPDFTDEDIDYELDTDSDSLPDYYEDILGTDKDKADTDGDGLVDGDEVFFIGTDPINADSDDNGINDGEEDPDSDGLTNAKECEIGTSPVAADSDMDGLTDGDEVNTHGTDPLKYDSDEDSISDGDEITLGLDPNSGSTNGTPDSERTFTQVVSADSEVFSAINDDEETPFDVSLEIKAAGVAEKNLAAYESGYSAVMQNNAVIGIIPQFSYSSSLSVEEVTVKFELENSVINNTLGTYAENNDGFKGIKRFNVFMFFEDVNMLLPIETNYDETNNIVSATTNRVGTYCLIDMELFFDNLGIAPAAAVITTMVEDGEAMTKNPIDTNEYKCYTVNEYKAKAGNKDNFDVAFIIDRVNYNDEMIDLINKKILETAKKIWKISSDVNVSVYAINGDGVTHYEYYGVFTTTEELSAALENINHNTKPLEFTTPDGKTDRLVCLSKAVDSIIDSSSERKMYCFAFFDSDNNKYQNINNSKLKLNTIKYGGKKINISICSYVPEKSQLVEDYSDMCYAVALYKMTNGIKISAEDFTGQAIKHIYGDVPNIMAEYNVIIATNYKTISLLNPITEREINNAKKYRYNYGHTSEFTFDEEDLIGCADTDTDGLWDFQEIKVYKGTIETDENQIIKIVDGFLELPSVDDMFDYVLPDIYSQYEISKYKESFRNQFGDYGSKFWETCVLPIYSDPTLADGDCDDINDSLDAIPLRRMPSQGLLYQSERLPELTATGEIAEDLMYNDKSLLDLYLMGNKLGRIAESTINNKDNLEKAIKDFKYLFTIFSTNTGLQMKIIISDMLNHFRYGQGEPYINPNLSEVVAKHPSTQRYMRKNYIYIINSLIEHNGNLEAILNLDKLDEDFDSTGKPKYNQSADLTNGLKICIDDTWGHTIEVYNYKFDGTNFSGMIRYTIYDHFGLDSADVSQDKTSTEYNMGNLYGKVDGFASWYVLQHFGSSNEFIPFVDYVILDVPFSSSINDEKKKYEKTIQTSDFIYNINGLIRK